MTDKPGHAGPADPWGLDSILRDYLSELSEPVARPREVGEPALPTRATVVLVVDADRGARRILEQELERTFRVIEAASPAQALAILESTAASAVVTNADVGGARNAGRELLAQVLVRFPSCARILIASPSAPDAGQIAHRTVLNGVCPPSKLGSHGAPPGTAACPMWWWRRGDVLVAVLKQLAVRERKGAHDET
jgi:CheY-like chemotaxis protein